MTDIPDDVVERALKAFNACAWYENGGSLACIRAALRVAVEWEREQCAKIVDDCWKWPVRRPMEHLAAAIRARSNPPATE